MLNIPVELRNLFKTDGVRKNIRIHFPNGEREDITNENIVKDSFSFSERLCSRDTLRFGLCESNVLEFECFDVENIKGYEIEASVEAIIDEPIIIHRIKEDLQYDTISLTASQGFTISFDKRESGTLSWEFLETDYTGVSYFDVAISTDDIYNEQLGYGNHFSIHIEDTPYVNLSSWNMANVTLTNVRFVFDDKEYDEVYDDVYSVPYGMFVVDSCDRQSEFNNRKVVAYSKEIQWNDITNPVERAKMDGRIKCVQNTAYNFSIDPFVLSNVYNDKSNPDISEDQCGMDSYTFESATFLSDQTISNPQGNKWQQINNFSFRHYYIAVAYGGGKFVCIRENESNVSTAPSTLFYSVDAGVTWNEIKADFDFEIPYEDEDGYTVCKNIYYNNVIYGKDRFVCVGCAGRSYYSLNGEDWFPMTGLEQGSIYIDSDKVYDGNIDYYELAYGNGRFVCIGTKGESYYSVDGETWLPLNGLPEDSYYKDFKMVFGDDKFVAIEVGSGDCYFLTDGEEWDKIENTFYTSTGGISSESYLQGLITFTYNGIEFVYINWRGYLTSSVDGINIWNYQPGYNPNLANIRDMLYINRRYFAVGLNSYGVWNNLDNMLNWSDLSDGLMIQEVNSLDPTTVIYTRPLNYNKMAYGDGVIIAVGDMNGLARFEDNGNTHSQYECVVKVTAKCVQLTSNTDADKLYKMNFKNVDEDVLSEMEFQINKYIGNIYDKKNTTTKLFDISDYSELRNIIIQGAFKSRTALTTSTYGNIYIPLNGYNFIYPYLNLNSKEIPYFYTSTKTIEKSLIMVPHVVRLEFAEYRPSYTANSFTNTGTFGGSQHILRNYDDITASIILNLSTLKMSVNRRKVNNLYSIDVTKMYDVKSIVEGFAEFKGLFGRYNRYGSFEFFSINRQFGIYPAEDLYPMETLYARSTNADLFTRGLYHKVSYDEEPSKFYDKVSVTYIDTSGIEVYVEKEIDHAILNNPGEQYQEYSLDGNYIIENCKFTAAQIDEILEQVASGIKYVSYIPADINAIGLPYIETGDVIRVITRDSGFETIILSRDLSGDQLLSDNYQSRG